MSCLKLILSAVFILTCTTAMAKRRAPAEVAAVRSGDVEYRVPHSQMGCIEAWDVPHNRILWRKQIYVVHYDPSLESDVQDVFIANIALKEKTLSVKNERNSEYELNLESLEVKVIKGTAVHKKA